MGQETLATLILLCLIYFFFFLMVSYFSAKISNYFYHQITHFIEIEYAKIIIWKCSSKKSIQASLTK